MFSNWTSSKEIKISSKEVTNDQNWPFVKNYDLLILFSFIIMLFACPARCKVRDFEQQLDYKSKRVSEWVSEWESEWVTVRGRGKG